MSTIIVFAVTLGGWLIGYVFGALSVGNSWARYAQLHARRPIIDGPIRLQRDHTADDLILRVRLIGPRLGWRLWLASRILGGRIHLEDSRLVERFEAAERKRGVVIEDSWIE